MTCAMGISFSINRYLLGERVPPPCKPCSSCLLAVEAGEPQHLGDGGGEIEQMLDKNSSGLKSYIILQHLGEGRGEHM